MGLGLTVELVPRFDLARVAQDPSSFLQSDNSLRLQGTGLVLQDNSRDDLRVNANGAFTFTSRVAKGNTYSVTVKTQPSNPAQTCTVRDGSGTMAKANIQLFTS